MGRSVPGTKAMSGTKGSDRDASPLPAPGRASPDPMRGFFGTKVGQPDTAESWQRHPRSLC